MDDFEVFGAEAAAARLAKLIHSARPVAPRLAADDRRLLSPPVVPTRDHFDGFALAESALVVFGAYGTPWSKPLGRVLAAVRERHLLVWRRYGTTIAIEFPVTPRDRRRAAPGPPAGPERSAGLPPPRG